MASTHELLQAIADMQKNAQQNMPVIPRNGNPGGAYNMPQKAYPQPNKFGQPSAPQGKGSPYFYPWMAPSPSVNKIRDMIKPPLDIQDPYQLPTDGTDDVRTRWLKQQAMAVSQPPVPVPVDQPVIPERQNRGMRPASSPYMNVGGDNGVQRMFRLR